MLKSIIAGGAICLTSLISWIINISVLVVLIRKFRKHNSIYILAIMNILGNILQVSLCLMYMGPSGIIQRDFVPPAGVKFFSFWFQCFWYSDLFFQVVMSLNRFLTVVYHKEKMFTRARCWTIGFSLYTAGITLAFLSDYVIPCCTAYVHYPLYSYAYTETGTNYVNLYIDIPLNFSSSSLCFVMYFFIFVYVHKANRTTVGISSVTANVRRSKEVRYAVQFAICSLFACLSWVLFRIFPFLTFIEEIPELCSLTTLCLIGHCTANSLVFLIFNQEFKSKYFGQPSNVSQVRAFNSATTNNTAK